MTELWQKKGPWAPLAKAELPRQQQVAPLSEEIPSDAICAGQANDYVDKPRAGRKPSDTHKKKAPQSSGQGSQIS